MIRNRIKKLLAITLGAMLTVSQAAPVLAKEAACYAEASPWYESIPEMLAAGEYEEGVVIAGIIPEKKEKIAADEVEEIMEVDAGIAEVTPEEEEVSITLIRRDGMTTEKILRELAEDSSVVFAEPNYIIRNQSEETTFSLDDINRISSNLATGIKNNSDKKVLQTAADPEDIVIASDLTGLQWGNSSSATLTEGAGDVSINVPDFGAEGSDMTGDPITVAVLDAHPIDFTHPDLKDVAYTFTPEEQELLGCDEHGYNAAWNSADGKLNIFPGGDHGTHCAGIIGASWDGHGISGVASNVRLISVQLSTSDDTTSLACILRGLDFVRRANELTNADIRITSNSWTDYQNFRAYDAAMRKLGRDQGVISIISAGNESIDTDQMNSSVSATWDNPYVISVAATDVCGDLASYSCYGRQSVTLGAPGSGILSTVLSDETSYIPDAAPNKYYNGFEEETGLTVCQIDPEEKWMEDWVETDVCDDIGYSGTHVLRLGFHADEPYDEEDDRKRYEFSFELGDVSSMDVKAGDHVGFAAEASDYFAVVDISCYDADGNSISTDYVPEYYTRPNSWGLTDFMIPDGTDFSNFRFSFCVEFFSEAACDQLYFDSLGIGSDCVAYAFMDGTSMACPAVSGAAAVIASRFPEARGAELAALVKSSVRSLPSLKDKTETGGIIDLSVDLSDPTGVGPVISSLNVNREIVTLSGRNFGSIPGGIILTKEKTNGQSEAVDAVVVSWTDNKVVLEIEDYYFMGIMSAELTSALNGKKDRITRLIRLDYNIYDFELSLDNVELTGIFDQYDMPALETEGVMEVIGDELYFMPVDRRLEGVPANRRLFKYSLSDSTWQELAQMPVFMEKVSSAVTSDGMLYIKGTLMDDEDGYPVKRDEDTFVIGIYDPVSRAWRNEVLYDVDPDDVLCSDGKNLYIVGEIGIIRYDPPYGLGETLFTFDNDEIELENPTAAISGDNLYLFDGINYRAWVVQDMQTDPVLKELILPEVVNGDYVGDEMISPMMHGGALVAVNDGVMLIGPEAVDGSTDSFVVKNGSMAFEPYEQRVSDGRIVAVSAVSARIYSDMKNSIVDRVYVIATSMIDVGKIIFRATDYSSDDSYIPHPVDPDPVIPDPVEPEPELPTAKYANEWVNGKWYNKDGSQTYTAVGSWKKNEKGSWYEDTRGWYPRNRWQKIDGKWYFFDKKGYRECSTYRNGWYLGKDGAWDGKKRAAGWKKDDTGWKYILSDGTALQDGWRKIDGAWYFFQPSGYAAQGEYIKGWWLNPKSCSWTWPYRASWHKNSHGWWYGDSSGWYARNKWQKIDGAWYYFDNQGYMVSGSVTISGKTYIFDASGRCTEDPA